MSRILKRESIMKIMGMIVAASFSAGTFAACTPKANTPLEQPDSNYVVNGNGTVTDYSTGLMWKQCSEGMTYSAGACTGTASTHTWKAALEIPGAAFAGFSDWRVPNANELSSIVDRSCAAAPKINITIFPSAVASVYWASTPYGNASAGQSINAWYVNFSTGVETITAKDSARYVRLVRAGL